MQDKRTVNALPMILAIAVVEAIMQGGYEQIVKALSTLAQQTKHLREENKKDDKLGKQGYAFDEQNRSVIFHLYRRERRWNPRCTADKQARIGCAQSVSLPEVL